MGHARGLRDSVGYGALVVLPVLLSLASCTTDDSAPPILAGSDSEDAAEPDTISAPFEPTFEVAEVFDVTGLTDPQAVIIQLKGQNVVNAGESLKLVPFIFRSQVWHGNGWDHACTAYVPNELNPALEGIWAVVHAPATELAPGLSVDQRFARETAEQLGVPVVVIPDLPPPNAIDSTDDAELASVHSDCFDAELVDDGLASCARRLTWTSEDLTWNLEIPMVRAYMRALSAIERLPAVLAEQDEDLSDVVLPPAENFVILGAGRRGRAAWLAAAIDERIAGVMVSSFDEAALDIYYDEMALIWNSGWPDGEPSEWQAFLEQPFGWVWRTLMDPAVYLDNRPELVAAWARGTNDTRHPLGASQLYEATMPLRTERLVEPNWGHGFATEGQLALWRRLIRRVGGQTDDGLVSLKVDFVDGVLKTQARLTGASGTGEMRLWVGAGSEASPFDVRQSVFESVEMPVVGIDQEDRVVFELDLNGSGTTWAVFAEYRETTASGEELVVTSWPRTSWHQAAD